MSVAEFLQLPPAVRIAFVILIWPALWAGASFIAALASDIVRQRRKQGASGVTGGVLSET